MPGAKDTWAMFDATADAQATWTTMLRYHHRLAAGSVWAILGNGRRALAPRLLQRANRMPTR